MRYINGQLESQYVLGAIGLVERELASAALRSDLARMTDCSERLDELKRCLVAALRAEAVAG